MKTISVGDRVRVVSNFSKNINSIGRVGIVKSINENGETWVDFPNGSGGFMGELVLHNEDTYAARKNVLVLYKANEVNLEDALNELERIDISLHN